VLTSLDLKRHLAQIYDKDIPLSCLPTFLHEVTHHWCFTSPVGFASLLLFFRARREAMRYFLKKGQRSGDKLYDVLDAVLRYDFAQGMMRPLAEGIALFAEHDACTGFTKIISEPMLLAGTLFAQGLAVRSKPAWEKLPLVLAGGRLTPPQIRRKADLLMQPFSTANGGYLPGYLLVKGLWLQNFLELNCKHCRDTDFYLQFIRSYFYDDWELVARLLDPDRSDVGALGPIAEQIQLRLISFATEQNRQQQAEAFEKRSLKGKALMKCSASLGGLHFYYDEFHETTAEAAKGKQRIQALHQELFSDWPDDEMEQSLVRMDLETLQFWSTINLGHTTVDAEVAQQRLNFLENGTRLFSTKAPQQLADGWRGEVDVDIMVDTSDYGMFGFVSAGGELLDSWKLSNTEVPDRLRTSRIHAKSRARLMQSSQALLTEAMEEERISIERGHVQRELKRLTEGVYGERALPCLSDEKAEEVRRLMTVDGFLPLLGGDLRLLADAAAASLCVSVHHKLESVSSFHNWTKSSPLEAVSEIASTLGDWHIRSFAIDGRSILGSVI
jgi:hypothetical protein